MSTIVALKGAILSEHVNLAKTGCGRVSQTRRHNDVIIELQPLPATQPGPSKAALLIAIVCYKIFKKLRQSVFYLAYT